MDSMLRLPNAENRPQSTAKGPDPERHATCGLTIDRSAGTNSAFASTFADPAFWREVADLSVRSPCRAAVSWHS
jgi:hypothetical protein